MRLVVLGTGPFAVPMFQSLLSSSHDIAALVTRPTPASRGREKVALNPMRDLAQSRGVAVHEPASVNAPEGIELLKRLQPELLVVCDYGQILSREALAIAPLGGINLHGSLLPKYRGAAPVHWAILNGDAETGVSVIHMTPRLDGGPILATRRTPIGPEETMPDLEARLADLGIEPVHEAIAMLEKWDRTSPLGMPQDPSQATQAPRLKKEDGAIDWTESAEQIRNHIRALKPWPGSYTFWQRSGQEALRLVVDRAEVERGRRTEDRGQETEVRGQGSESVPGTEYSVLSTKASTEPGRILVADGKRLHVATGNGVLSIVTLQPAGKRHMAVDEFLRGYPVRAGDRFGRAPTAT